MTPKEKARQEAEPIPNNVRQDNSEHSLSLKQLQVSRLTRRCAISAAMAETLAPLAFGASA